MRVAGHITGKLSEFFVDSKLTSIVILGCLICGLWAVLSTPREENPQITMPGALVQVVLPGAMPSEVEQTVLKPLEAIVNQIPGVDHTEGAASDSVARLTVRFKVGEEKEASLNKLYDRVYSGRHLLPAAASVPMIVSADADDVAAVTVTLASEKYDDFALRRIANAMRDELLSMADVSTTTVEGGRSREFTVAIDPERLQSFGATLDSVRMAVAASNVAAPLGSVVENGLEQKVRLANGIEGVDELRSLPIGVFSGRTLRLGDVAEITDGPAARRTMTTRFAYGRSDADNYVLTGGREMNAVTLAVAKKKNTNAVEVADQVIERVERMKATVPEGVHVVVTRNDGERANDAVNLLLEHLGIALVSVVAVTWLFLGRRPALIVGLSIPLILAITLTITKIDGLTINRLSLYALIIALGLLVDDAIVVVENVVRHFGLGSKESKPVQVVRAADEIGSPTMMATFTVMLVFYSLVPTLTGMPKQYFHPVGVTVPVAIFASLFIAYSVVPWMCRHWIPMSHEKGGEPPKEEPILIARVYDAVAGRVIGYPVRELVLMLALAASFAASCVLPAWQFIRPEGPAGEPSAFGVQMGFLSKDNKNTFNVTVKMKEGTALEVTDRAVRDVAAVVSRIPEVVNYQSWTGEGGIDDFNSLLKGAGEKGSNIGAVRVNFTNKDTGRRSTIEIASELREALRPVAAAWPGSTIQVVEDPPGPPLVATVLTEVYGRDPKELRVISDSIEAEFRKTYDMVEIVRNAEADVVERRLAIDREKAALSGVNAAEAAGLLRKLVSGDVSGYAHVGGEREPVPVRLFIPDEAQFDPSLLSGVTVPGAGGARVALSSLVTTETGAAEQTIRHKDGVPMTRIGGELGWTTATYAVIDLNNRLEGMALPAGGTLATSNLGVSEVRPDLTQSRVELLWEGEIRMMLNSYRDLVIALSFAVGGIYLMLVAYYKSFLLPVIALSAVFMGVIGVFPGHWLLGEQFSATSLIGFTALAGIVVRNSFLLIDFVIDNLRLGMPLKEAVLKAGSVRMRPILLTSLCVVCGSLIMLTDAVFRGLAISLIFGTLVSACCTVFVVPILLYQYYKAFPFHADEDGTKAAATEVKA